LRSLSVFSFTALLAFPFLKAKLGFQLGEEFGVIIWGNWARRRLGGISMELDE